MKNLDAPFENGSAHLDLVVGRKRGHRRHILQIILPTIHGRYEDFDIAAPNLETIDPYPWSQPQSEALTHCFDSPVITRKKLTESIPERLSFCPYCVIRHANDWDHYMPKAIFPEFTVHPGNLVRVCASCNNLKSTNLIHPDRAVIHPYFDDLNSFTFLFCDIVGNPTPVPNYRLHFPEGTREVLSAVIQRHFEEFDLHRLYELEGGSQLIEYARELQYRMDNKLSRPIFEREIDAKLHALFAQDLGLNHWKVALWQGARRSEDFFSYVNAGLPG